MTYSRQAGERVIDAPCPNFPKCLISGSHQCCSSVCRWVHYIPASLLQFSDLCYVFLHTPPSPLMSLRSDFSRSCCWCSGLPAASASCGHPQGPAGKSVSQGGIQLSRLRCLCPKQLGKAQDEDFSRGEMVPSQRAQERDAAS